MRTALFFASMVIIALGIWMVGAGFIETAPADAEVAEQISATPGQTGNPIFLGTLLMAAGVVFLVVISRRK
jgi:hypothetical protein